MIADGAGCAIGFRIAPGQLSVGHPALLRRSWTLTGSAHELPHALPLLDRLPNVPLWVVADRGTTSHAFSQHIWDRGARPVIPPQRHEAPIACPEWICHNRYKVERLWARLKEWRAVATRYEKTANSFLGVLSIAAALDWLRR